MDGASSVGKWTLRRILRFAGNPMRHILAHLQDPLYRNGYALTLSSAATSGLGFIYWIVAANYYPADLVGISTAAITAMMLLSGLSSIYLDGTLARYVPVAGRSTPRLILTVYLVLIITGIVTTSIFLYGLRFWFPALIILTENPWSSAGFVCATIVWSIFNVQDGTLIGMRKSILVPLENASYAVLKLLLLVAFANLMPAYGIFLSWFTPLIILILIVNHVLFRQLIPAHIREADLVSETITSSEVARYAWGNYFGMVCSLAMTMLPPLMVLQLTDSRSSAYFYMPWVMASLFRVLATDTSTSLVVEGVMNRSRLAQIFRAALLNTSRIVVPAMVVCVVLSSHILSFFGSDYASGGTGLLRLLALASIPNIVITLYIGWLRAQNNILAVVIVQLLIAVAFLSLSYIWLQMYGVTGVGMAMLAVQTLGAVVLLMFPLRFLFYRSCSTNSTN